MSLYSSHPGADPSAPVLVIAMDGWVDAGLGATRALAHLLEAGHTEVMTTFDSDSFIDSRARRPTITITDGVNVGLDWPEIQIRLGKDRSGNDVAYLVGPEPDFRWHAFVEAVCDLSLSMGARLAVGMGAFPAPAPHTRPVRLACTATEAGLAAQMGVIGGTLQVPTGIEGALEEGFRRVGIPAIGLWARVPHYTAAMAYPGASAALVDGLCAVAGLDIDSSPLHEAALATRDRVDELIAQSNEHRAMVHQLEVQVDSTEGPPP
ncbi:MAG: proteasome assembly chaperone family protein, partial [Acidimicrobiales bacterium]